MLFHDPSRQQTAAGQRRMVSVCLSVCRRDARDKLPHLGGGAHENVQCMLHFVVLKAEATNCHILVPSVLETFTPYELGKSPHVERACNVGCRKRVGEKLSHVRLCPLV